MLLANLQSQNYLYSNQPRSSPGATIDDLPDILLRIACASATVLSWKVCWRPGTPWVVDVDPTAMINLSYLRHLVQKYVVAGNLYCLRDIDIMPFTIRPRSLDF